MPPFLHRFGEMASGHQKDTTKRTGNRHRLVVYWVIGHQSGAFFPRGGEKARLRGQSGALSSPEMTKFALSDNEAGESSVSFSSPRCPHTGPQCGPAEIHGCFILGILRCFTEIVLSIRRFSVGL